MLPLLWGRAMIGWQGQGGGELVGERRRCEQQKQPCAMWNLDPRLLLLWWPFVFVWWPLQWAKEAEPPAEENTQG